MWQTVQLIRNGQYDGPQQLSAHREAVHAPDKGPRSNALCLPPCPSLRGSESIAAHKGTSGTRSATTHSHPVPDNPSTRYAFTFPLVTALIHT